MRQSGAGHQSYSRARRGALPAFDSTARRIGSCYTPAKPPPREAREPVDRYRLFRADNITNCAWVAPSGNSALPVPSPLVQQANAMKDLSCYGMAFPRARRALDTFARLQLPAAAVYL